MGIKAQTIINKVKNSLDLSMIEVAKEISSGLQEEKWKKKKKKKLELSPQSQIQKWRIFSTNESYVHTSAIC